MAENASDHLEYFLRIPVEDQDYLYDVRQWPNLKVAVEEGSVWVKGMTEHQLQSAELKSLIRKQLFYSKEGKLFLFGNLVPEQNIPSLLWSPIDRLLQLEQPDYNHNYFGVQEKAEITLVPAKNEIETIAMLVECEALGNYLEFAPEIRLKNIRWTLLNGKALLIGTPLLPIKGDAYWKKDNHLLPAGYDFEFSFTRFINAAISLEKNQWVFWNKENTYRILDNHYFQPLSLGSFRLTFSTNES